MVGGCVDARSREERVRAQRSHFPAPSDGYCRYCEMLMRSTGFAQNQPPGVDEHLGYLGGSTHAGLRFEAYCNFHK